MDETKTALQSATIRAALTAIALNSLSLVTMATGKVFDIEAVQEAINYGVTMAVNAATIWYAYKAIRGRINATTIIEKKE